MVDNQHRRISGYRDLTEDEVEVVNLIKGLQVEMGAFWRRVRDDVPDVDHRDLAIARTHFQEGFSAFVRAVARPLDPFDDYDDDDEDEDGERHQTGD